MENKNKGLYEQLKTNKPEYKDLTKENLIQIFEEVFASRNTDMNKKIALPLEWVHHEWEENGERFSCWKLMTGGIFCQLTTGDKGKEEIDKIFESEHTHIPILTKIKNDI